MKGGIRGPVGRGRIVSPLRFGRVLLTLGTLGATALTLPMLALGALVKGALIAGWLLEALG